MTTLTSAASIFDHTLDPVSGYDKERGLNFTANMSPNVEFDMPQGRVVHLNPNGEFETGVEGQQMPLFLMPSSTPWGAMPTLSPHWAGVGTYPRTGLPSSGGLELATTEYDTDNTYAPNDLLTAVVDNVDANAGGLITNKNAAGTALTAPYKVGGTTRTIIGIVSKAPEKLKNKNTVLCFWTLPPIIGVT